MEKESGRTKGGIRILASSIGGILGAFAGSVIAAPVFFLIGNWLVPAQEFGPLGGIIGAILIGIPIGGMAGGLLGIGVTTVLSGAPNRIVSYSMSAFGLLIGSIAGMLVSFKQELLLVTYITSIAGLFIGCVTGVWISTPAQTDSLLRLKSGLLQATIISTILVGVVAACVFLAWIARHF
ncbi:hypothetical protein FYK55_14800 [Roseiconus nitratireducens]|uniref:Uncharacterized protein n=1 Tax=Roseiconus nitratireducens TaxID=2605748 RepID=A0A5M6D5L4_9BACT|nr:hypothetical protein [Roseiconus nitratireducens]KAA5542781.1 hypothetical protein FYK55_14800 [Roseiconus nitratireducens]